MENKPDIITENKERKTCIVTDVAMPIGMNVTQEESEKKLKYKS